jgi:hypothetical protein
MSEGDGVVDEDGVTTTTTGFTIFPHKSKVRKTGLFRGRKQFCLLHAGNFDGIRGEKG